LSYTQSPALGSIAATTTRVLRKDNRVTCAALENASATFSTSPNWKSTATFPGTSS
jgi:hypothetical protein